MAELTCYAVLSNEDRLGPHKVDFTLGDDWVARGRLTVETSRWRGMKIEAVEISGYPVGRWDLDEPLHVPRWAYANIDLRIVFNEGLVLSE